MIEGSCEGCRFATPVITDDQGITMKCRRFPPMLFVINEEVTQTFPDADMRCGEYKTESSELGNVFRTLVEAAAERTVTSSMTELVPIPRIHRHRVVGGWTSWESDEKPHSHLLPDEDTTSVTETSNSHTHAYRVEDDIVSTGFSDYKEE